MSSGESEGSLWHEGWQGKHLCGVNMITNIEDPIITHGLAQL